jgi:LCP family protein required for cell wall assembly
MNCAEARRLLGLGVRPGSATSERARLGFHLASCPACRAYQEARQDDLLAWLLAQTDAKSAVAPPAAEPAPEPARTQAEPRAPRRMALGRLLWYAGMGVLAALILTVALGVSSVALSIFNIHRNVQAMIVPTSNAAVDLPARPPEEASAPAPTAATVVATSAPTLVPTQAPTATPRPTTTPRPTPTPAAPPAGGPVTVLLLGSDRRPGESEPSRTDAIIVARIDPERGRVALLSLPRDLWVSIPGYGEARINAAHVWGQIYSDPEGGIGVARRTVSELLGIPIDYTVLIDFEGFIGAIDALGGIDVDVPKELYDGEFPTMDYGYTVAHFLPGRQRMDGATALMYSRIRHPDSDIERMRRQQAVLVGILGRLREQGAAQTFGSLEDVTAALRGYVRTDMPEERVIGLAWALRNITPDHVERYLVDENMISFGIGSDRWAALIQPGALETLVGQLLGQ